MRAALCDYERFCEMCGDPFWGSAGANFCSNRCRVRHWRARQVLLTAPDLTATCREVLARSEEPGSTAYGKLLPLLLRFTVVELRRRGWDPYELLWSLPDDPVSADDTAPGGFQGRRPHRRRWLYPPDQEVALLDARIAERQHTGRSVRWFLDRRKQLTRLLARRGGG